MITHFFLSVTFVSIFLLGSAQAEPTLNFWQGSPSIFTITDDSITEIADQLICSSDIHGADYINSIHYPFTLTNFSFISHNFTHSNFISQYTPAHWIEQHATKNFTQHNNEFSAIYKVSSNHDFTVTSGFSDTINYTGIVNLTLNDDLRLPNDVVIDKHIIISFFFYPVSDFAVTMYSDHDGITPYDATLTSISYHNTSNFAVGAGFYPNLTRYDFSIDLDTAQYLIISAYVTAPNNRTTVHFHGPTPIDFINYLRVESIGYLSYEHTGQNIIPTRSNLIRNLPANSSHIQTFNSNWNPESFLPQNFSFQTSQQGVAYCGQNYAFCSTNFTDGQTIKTNFTFFNSELSTGTYDILYDIDASAIYNNSVLLQPEIYLGVGNSDYLISSATFLSPVRHKGAFKISISTTTPQIMPITLRFDGADTIFSSEPDYESGWCLTLLSGLGNYGINSTGYPMCTMNVTVYTLQILNRSDFVTSRDLVDGSRFDTSSLTDDDVISCTAHSYAYDHVLSTSTLIIPTPLNTPYYQPDLMTAPDYTTSTSTNNNFLSNFTFPNSTNTGLSTLLNQSIPKSPGIIEAENFLSNIAPNGIFGLDTIVFIIVLFFGIPISRSNALIGCIFFIAVCGIANGFGLITLTSFNIVIMVAFLIYGGMYYLVRRRY